MRIGLVTLLLAGGAAWAAEDAVRGVEWKVVEIAGAPVPAGVKPTMTILQDGRAAGFGGCNRYGAGATIEGDRLRFSQAMSTMMACEPPKMDTERRWLDSLDAVRRFAVEGATLRLLGEDGRVVARLTR